MLGVVRLHDDLAARAVPSRASRRLRDEHEAALRRAEIGQIQTRIGTDDANRLHAGQVVSLCNHLRAEENVEVAPAELRQNLRMRELSPRRIAIHAHKARCRE